MTTQPNFYELDLSDEHMAQIARFRRLGDFDRQRWLVMRGFCEWMKQRFAPRPVEPLFFEIHDPYLSICLRRNRARRRRDMTDRVP